LRRYLKFAALLLLAAVILWWFGRRLDWSEVRRSLGQANPKLLFVAVLLVCSSYVLRSYRWRALLAPITPTSLRELFSATTIGFGSVFLLGRAGEVVRPVVLPMRDHRVRPSASIVTIMVERIFDSVAVVVLFAFNLIWFRPEGHASELAVVRYTGIGLLAMAVLGVGGLIWFKHRSRGAIEWVDQRLLSFSFIPNRVVKAVKTMLEHLASALSVLVDARELFITSAWTIALWATIIGANLSILWAFGRTDFGVKETVFVLGWALVGSLVPTPGGAAGAFHAATAAGLVFLGVKIDRAAAIAIVTHLIDFSPALGFGLYFVVRGDISVSRLKQMITSESEGHLTEDQLREPLVPAESEPVTIVSVD
jgi:uncharacterized protein (TIRG00374 family)